MTLRILSHRIGLVVLCLIPVVLAATACGGSGEGAGCSGSGECVSVSQVKTGLERMGSFSFGGPSDMDVTFRAVNPNVDHELSFDRLPSSCPKELPVFRNAKLVYASGGTSSDGAYCVAFWDIDATAEELMAYYQEGFSKDPWSVRQVAPVGEDGSAWLSFNRSGKYAGLLGVGPTGGPYTIALFLGGDNGGE